MKILNLYAGLGGNRKSWTDCDVTAVEWDHKIKKVYESLYPDDFVWKEDAHEFLLDHYADYDFIWSSPPCQSHSKMIRSGRNRKPRYPDLRLYEEILFLQHNFKGKWVVENVVPYYKPLIPAYQSGRHLFWSNVDLGGIQVPHYKDFINSTNVDASEKLKEWLGIEYEGNLYYGDNHCPSQVLRNCVHPVVGEQIMKRAIAQDDLVRELPTYE